MLLVLGRGEMVVFTAVNAVLLHNSAVDTWTEYSVVITVQMENFVSACRF